MIKINFKDGKTVDLDLFDQKQVDVYKSQMKNIFFNNRISGMAIFQNNQLHVIQKPAKYKLLKWTCGKIAEAEYQGIERVQSKDVGETISLTVDNKVKTNLTYYFSNKMIKNTVQIL